VSTSNHRDPLDLGVNAWFCKQLSLEHQLRLISKVGFSGVELPCFPQYSRPGRQATIKRLMSKYNLKLVALNLGLPFGRRPLELNLHSENPRVRRNTLKYVYSWLDQDSSLGCDLVYVCSVKKGTNINDTVARKMLLDSLAACGEHAEGEEVRIALEPLPSGIIPTMKCAAGFVSSLRMKNVGLLIDTGHLAISDESFANSVKIAGSSLMHVHLNNNDGVRDCHWPPQKGKVKKSDYSSLVRALRKAEYKGWVSLEILNLSLSEGEKVLRDSRKFASGL